MNNNHDVKGFVSTKITNADLKELLLEFFKEKGLLSKDISGVEDSIKVDLAKRVIDCKLFDKHYPDIVGELNKTNLLPKESIIWSIIEDAIKLQIPDWIRKVNPITNIRSSKADIMLLVGTKEKGVVSLKDILPMITVAHVNPCCLILEKDKYYLIITNPARGLRSDDCSMYRWDWVQIFEECSCVSMASIICGVDEEFEYEDATLDEIYYYSNLDTDGSISLQEYLELSRIDQEKIDKLITIQECEDPYSGLGGFIFGLGYIPSSDRLVLIQPEEVY